MLGVARISTDLQDVKSLEDQEALYIEYLDRNLGRPYEFRMLASKGSGESLEREDYHEAIKVVGNNVIDLVISELRIDAETAKIAVAMFNRLEDGASYQEVANWLNDAKVPTGPSCRMREWSGEMVRRLATNPILKGQRFHNRLHSVRVNGTGRRKAVPAPPRELLTRQCTHLVIIAPERFDRVVPALARRNAHFCRKRKRDGSGEGDAFTGRSST